MAYVSAVYLSLGSAPTYPFPVRHIPDWCPGARIKALPPGTRENLQNFVNKPFEHVKKEMVRECRVYHARLC